jgi:hypothetical protein
MARRWLRRGAGVALALGVAAAVVALPASAVNEDLTIFSGFLSMDDSTSLATTTIGTGGDGSLVLQTSSFSFIPPEEPITADLLADKPYLYYNPDLFSWSPGESRVRQFTATAIVENSDGDALQFGTENDQPAVYTRTGDARDEDGTRITAVAYRTNADPDPELFGPIKSVDEIGVAFRVLGSAGRAIVYWDSELAEAFPATGGFVPLVAVPHFHQSFSPSVAFRTRVTHRGNSAVRSFRTIEMIDSWVAFAGSANNDQDNWDGNDEIHLWTRSDALDSSGVTGFVNNGGLRQLTHTTSGDCWAPAVSINGDVAFLSDADITGENGDGSVELFLYKRRRGDVRQLTKISPARTIGPPSWGDNGRRIAFASNANFGGGNVDGNMEIFSWKAGKFRQVTSSTLGDSHSPSMDPFGRTIVFLTDAELTGVVYGLVPGEEIVATPSRGRTFRQITKVNDGGTNEAPTVTRSRGGKVQVTWISSSDLDGRNSNNTRRIYRADVR